MRNIVKQNKQFLLAFFGILLIILSCSIFVSNSNMDPGSVTIQSITPVYDEEGTYSVGNTGVIFNDKEQVVKYNVVVQNNENYDVKVSDLQLSTNTEEFLKYTVENIELDDVIKAGETKELVVAFETVKTDGWGRNFNDELITTLYFTEIKKEEENPPPEEPQPEEPGDEPIEPEEPDDTPEEPVNPPTDEPDIETPEEPEINEPTDVPNVDEPNTDEKDENDLENEQPENNVIVPGNSNNNVSFGNNTTTNKPKPENNGNNLENNSMNNSTTTEKTPNEDAQEDAIETPNDETNHELGINQNITVEENNASTVVIIFVFGIATGVLGIGLVMVSKNKFTKYIVLFVIVGSSVKLAQADEIMNLEIPINVSYESQNIMKTSGCKYYTSYTTECDDYWGYNWQIKNFYIVNEITKFEEYAYQFDVSKDGNGKVIATMLVNEDDSSTYDLYLQADGIIYANEDASGYFADFYNISEITNLKVLDTSMVKDMSYMFMNTGRNADEFKLSFEFFDTSNVTNMRNMFRSIGYNSENLTLDVSNFDTSKVTNMRNMFASAGYNSKVFTLDLSNFDTSNVTDMGYMFDAAGCNSKVFTLDVSNFDTSKVTDMSYMFLQIGRNSETFTLDLSSFDTSNVTIMSYMFANAGRNSETFTLDLSNFDTSNVSSMFYTFYNTGYNSTNFNTSITIKNPKISYSYMFEGVATKENSKIIVNYTNATSELVDKMIATKSPNSNVVKGWNVDERITFTIGDTTYSAYEGMTWEQWVNSEFNTDGYYIYYDSVMKEENHDSYVLVANGDDYVSNYSEIVENHSYTLSIDWK